MLKRILSITLAVILAMSVFCISYAETEWSEEMENKYEILEGIGIVNMSEDGDWSAFRNMSKSAFINFACNLLSDYGFTEIYNEQAIQVAEDAGLIHKGQTDLNKPLYYDEAMTILVRLLGYGLHAETAGGYPAGYVSIANRLDLNKGLAAKSGERLREYDAILLLYNMINCPYVEIISYSDEGIIYGNTSENTFLYEYRKIYRVDGVLQSTRYGHLKTDMAVGENQVMIDGYVYQTSQNFNQYLGMQVEAYIKGNKNSGDELLMAFPIGNKEFVITAEDFVDISPDCTKLTYLDANENQKILNLSPAASVMYNGQPKRKDRQDFFIDAGEIRLVNNNYGNVYNVVFITDLETVVADVISNMNQTVSNAYTYNGVFTLPTLEPELGDVIEIVDETGPITISDIKNGDVLQVAYSNVAGRRVIKISVSHLKVTGVASTVKTSGGKTYVTVSDQTYRLSAAYQKARQNNDPKALAIQPGGNYIFHLDSAGDIAYVKSAANVTQYGIVMATRTENLFGADCHIKLFTTEGNWVELPFERKILSNIDAVGNVTTTSQKIAAGTVIGALGTAKGGVINVVSYTTNEEGYINRLDAAEADDGNGNDGRFNTIGTQTIAWHSNNSSFESQIYAEDDAVYWLINQNGRTEEEEYQVAVASDLVGDSEYDVTAFKVDEFGFAKLLVVEDRGSGKGNLAKFSSVFVVEDWCTAIGPEGEDVTMVSGYHGKYDSISYYVKDPTLLSLLDRGDVFSIHVDQKGYIDSFIENRDYSTSTVWELAANLNGKPSYCQGIVEKNDAANHRLKIQTSTSPAYNVVRTKADSPVCIYDSENGRIYRATVNDIERGDRIFVKTLVSNIVDIVIFR